MSLEMELAITAFSGAAALTSLCVLLAMLGTINPYHRPEVPSLSSSSRPMWSRRLMMSSSAWTHSG